MAIQKVFEFKEITFQYQSNGVATLQLFTDMPGGSLTSRISATIPSSAGARATFTLPLDGIEGTQFYPKVTPGGSTQIRLFKGKAQVRMIGIYLDGSLSVPEYWTTTPIALGA